jgi:hypothetical protein
MNSAAQDESDRWRSQDILANGLGPLLKGRTHAPRAERPGWERDLTGTLTGTRLALCRDGATLTATTGTGPGAEDH